MASETVALKSSNQSYCTFNKKAPFSVISIKWFMFCLVRLFLDAELDRNDELNGDD